jgi:hypothetical protein
MTLWSDFLTNDKRVIHKEKHYFPIYEHHFKNFVYKPVTFIESAAEWAGLCKCGNGTSVPALE